jgi:membrane protein involved in D-alanine export
VDFYAQPAFFVLLAAAIIPAAVLGAAGRRIKPYGLAVSAVFILLLFSRNLWGLVALVFCVGLASGTTFLYQRLLRHQQQLSRQAQPTRPKGTPPLAVWPFVLVAMFPLAAYKIGAPFEQDLFGFIGISYITFKMVQVLLELRDGIIQEIKLGDYLYFLLFFPPFTSGPIDRSRRFLDDANNPPASAQYLEMLGKGLLLILVGILYKTVISAVIFDLYSWAPTRSTTPLFDAVVALKDMYAYGLHLFFDFAGYSLMAMGAGYCFGIRVPRNFRAPFAAVDIKDFWNRWHITLSWWLRDFVFMRFTRQAIRRRWFSSRITPACLGYVLNMALMGVWHGLTVDYVAYGLYHGILLAVTEVYQKKSGFHKRNQGRWWYRFASWAITINAVFFGFAIFSGQALGALGLTGH